VSLSTNLISGLSSGFDWRTMIDQLMAIDYNRVELIEDSKSEYESKLAEWQNVNSMLLTLRSAASDLTTESAFNLYTSSTTSDTTTAASELLTVTIDSDASPGLYSIEVTNLAQSQKISSNSYSSTGTALGLSGGDILVSGKVVNIVSTDTLADIKDKINAVNTGTTPSNVTANIVQYGTNDYRLTLVNDESGADGLSVLNASTNDTLGSLGFIETASGSFEIKNSITGGAQSDLFTSSNSVIKDLLSLNTTQTSNQLKIIDTDGNLSNVIVASGEADIDLSRDSLTAIATAINNNKGAAAKLNASVVSETIDGATYYRLQVDGIYATNPFSDDDNIFQTLGLIEGGVGDLVGDVGDNALTTNGQIITTSTLLTDIDGYLDHTAAPQDKIVFTGTTTAGGDLTASPVTYNIASTDTVQDLLNEIEGAYGDVTASINADGKIQVIDNSTDTAGSSNLEVIFSSIIDKGQLEIGFSGADTDISSIRKRETAAGEDATIVVDSVTVTNSSNTITDVIEGVKLNLIGEKAGTTVTLKVERDLESIKTKIHEFADAYNAVMNYINTQFSYNEETESTGGILFGDGTLSSVKSDLIDIITTTLTGVSSDYNRLALIGVTLDLTNIEEGKYEDLTLSIDDDDLMDALETNFDDVKKIFIADGFSPSSYFEYISHTSDTQAGSYAISITQEATQSVVTGSEAVGTLAGGPVTVTITDYASGRVADAVQLEDGWDIDDVINALNSEFATEHTEQLQGEFDTTYSTSTLFSAIDADSNGEVITFSGTRRSGLSVSGSYTVDSTKPLGDLLEEIEDLYEDEITAALDENGKLIITDTMARDSQISFIIDTSNVDNLNFGTVSTTTEGRYAMEITASEGTGGDADHVVLTHNTYGTGHIILVEGSGADPLGFNTATQVWGKDVAGTINSETATGNGKALTLDNDGNNADGLTVFYTGTTASSTTFSLSLGIAELLDRQLGFITDMSDGYVTYKQTSLKNSIDNYETKIDSMTDQLNRKMEVMINRFVAMELALSKIQNQSDWLTGQVNAAWSGWV